MICAVNALLTDQSGFASMSAFSIPPISSTRLSLKERGGRRLQAGPAVGTAYDREPRGQVRQVGSLHPLATETLRADRCPGRDARQGGYFELLNYKGALRKYSVTLFTAEKKKLNFRAIRER